MLSVNLPPARRADARAARANHAELAASLRRSRPSRGSETGEPRRVIVLEGDFRLEALLVATDGDHGQGLLSGTEGDRAVLLPDAPRDVGAIPAFGVGPARDVARREDAGRARLEVLVDDDAPIDGESRFLGELDARLDADADDDDLGGERGAAGQRDPVFLDGADRGRRA